MGNYAVRDERKAYTCRLGYEFPVENRFIVYGSGQDFRGGGKQKERKMTVIIEFDFRWTWGIDNFEFIKGIRFGFFAIHLCRSRLDEFVDAYCFAKKEKNE